MSKTTKTRNGDKSGPDGTVVQTRRLNTGTQAIATIKVRCAPGTFEWRYGRHGNSLYHAGSQFARIWERAGIASCGSSAISDGAYGGGAGGIPDGRIRALDQANKISREIGGPMTRRLVAFCVEGRTPREIAASYNDQVSHRQVSETLDLDLLELARAMGFA